MGYPPVLFLTKISALIIVSASGHFLETRHKDLGVHHSTDLFHVQHELVKGTSMVLTNKKKKAEKAVEAANSEVNQRKAEKDTYFNGKPGPGRPPEDIAQDHQDRYGKYTRLAC